MQIDGQVSLPDASAMKPRFDPETGFHLPLHRLPESHGLSLSGNGADTAQARG